MKTRYSRSSILFLTAYILWVTVFLIKYTYIKNMLPMSDLVNYGQMIVMVLLIIKFIQDKNYKVQSFLGLAIVFLVGILEYSIQDKTVYMFMLFLFIYSAGNVDFEDILKVTLVIQVLVLTVTVSLAATGVIENGIWDIGARQRYDLGFIYCTFSSHLMLFITMIYCCLRKRMHEIEFLVLFGINAVLYYFNDTRLDMLIVCPFLLAYYFWSRFSSGVKDGFISKMMFQYSSIFMAAFIILLQKFYQPYQPVFIKLNQLLSSRLTHGNNAINTFGFRLFGQYIRWIGQGSVKKNPTLVYNYVDSSFLKYALNYGIVFMIILFIGLVWMGRRAIRTQNQALCLSLLFLYVFAMVDAELCVLAFHPFLLLMGNLLNPQEGGSYEKSERPHHSPG